jgi:hypothetical protein
VTFQTEAPAEAVVALCRWPTIGSEPVDQRLTGGLGQRWGPLPFGLQVDRESHRTGGARRATADGTSIAAPAASSTLISQGSIGLALYSILPHPAVLPNRLATCTAARQTANGTFHWLIRTPLPSVSRVVRPGRIFGPPRPQDTATNKQDRSC